MLKFLIKSMSTVKSMSINENPGYFVTKTEAITHMKNQWSEYQFERLQTSAGKNHDAEPPDGTTTIVLIVKRGRTRPTLGNDTTATSSGRSRPRPGNG